MSKRAPNRLEASGEHALTGHEIDRTRPLRFRINGQIVDGFMGDTVLSAALASGIVSAGLRDRFPLALNERFAPPVFMRGDKGTVLALPMERTPAHQGLELTTSPARWRVPALGRARAALGGLAGHLGTLGEDLDRDRPLSTPWIDLAAETTIQTDIIIIGGGVSGMSAARAAAKWGERIVLVERRQSLGGDAVFFGRVENEETPASVIARLGAELAQLPNVTVLTRTEAFAIFGRTVRVHQVQAQDQAIRSRVVALEAPRLLLATGMTERLPIFAGNRLPGVTGALAAFQRASRFGVWQGHRTVFNTVTSFSYRVAMQAKQANVDIERISDTRLDPHSRFVEFAKAYGIPLTWGLVPMDARLTGKRPASLEIRLASSVPDVVQAPEPIIADQLIVSGGWQPALELWHMAGGKSVWNAAAQRLEASGKLDGTELAGSLAGYRNCTACMASGEGAAARLFGKPAPKITDIQIAPMFESIDDPTPITPQSLEDGAPAYLDGGRAFAVHPALPTLANGRAHQKRRWKSRSHLTEMVRPLSVADVAAGVQLGMIPAEDAAIVTQERSGKGGDLVLAGQHHRLPVGQNEPDSDPNSVPDYLVGRFGSRAQIWRLKANDGRAFETGCLIYLGSDQIDPLEAVGVVLGGAANGARHGQNMDVRALIGKLDLGAGGRVFVHEISRTTPAQLVVIETVSD